jgi:hypothetical protein
VVEVEENRFKVNSVITDQQLVFVYGREVDDFHSVDYEAIAMLNVSVTQEQQRLIEYLREKNEKLQTEVDGLKERSTLLNTELEEIKLSILKLNQRNQLSDLEISQNQ